MLLSLESMLSVGLPKQCSVCNHAMGYGIEHRHAGWLPPVLVVAGGVNQNLAF
jgi:hypothetical protein